MVELFETIKPGLVWIIAGIILFFLEFAMPGFIIFFFGTGALIVGLLCFLLPISLNMQLILFIVISLVTLFFMRKKMQSIFMGKVRNGKELDDSLDDFLGQKATVIEKISPKRAGKIELHGTLWNAESIEIINKDQIVEITGKSNLTLTVKSI